MTHDKNNIDDNDDDDDDMTAVRSTTPLLSSLTLTPSIIARIPWTLRP